MAYKKKKITTFSKDNPTIKPSKSGRKLNTTPPVIPKEKKDNKNNK